MEFKQTQTKAERMAGDGSSETKSQGNAKATVAVEKQLGEMALNATADKRAGNKETVVPVFSFGITTNSGMPN